MSRAPAEGDAHTKPSRGSSRCGGPCTGDSRDSSARDPRRGEALPPGARGRGLRQGPVHPRSSSSHGGPKCPSVRGQTTDRHNGPATRVSLAHLSTDGPRRQHVHGSSQTPKDKGCVVPDRGGTWRHPRKHNLEWRSPGAGGGLGSWWSMGTKLQFGERRTFWRWMMRTDAQQRERTGYHGRTCGAGGTAGLTLCGLLQRSRNTGTCSALR